VLSCASCLRSTRSRVSLLEGTDGALATRSRFQSRCEYSRARRCVGPGQPANRQRPQWPAQLESLRERLLSETGSRQRTESYLKCRDESLHPVLIPFAIHFFYSSAGTLSGTTARSAVQHYSLSATGDSAAASTEAAGAGAEAGISHHEGRGPATRGHRGMCEDRVPIRSTRD
jgi:hypothetical protein